MKEVMIAPRISAQGRVYGGLGSVSGEGMTLEKARAVVIKNGGPGWVQRVAAIDRGDVLITL
jgi:hypothetical protein